MDSTNPSRFGNSVDAISRMVEQERERAAAAALVAVRRALARHGPAYVLGVLNGLEQTPIRVTIEALTNRDGR